jgi:CheY-like chemotaxis protein
MEIVLVVNDDPRNLVLVTTQLLLLGVQVVTASMQQDAVELARLLRPRLIILDLLLEKGDGWDTTHEIRELIDMPRVPIIIISAHTEAHDIERAQLAGADDFLPKPYDIQDLKVLLQRYLAMRV